MCQTSNSGSPATTHSATTLPMPPALAMPCAQKPAATKNPVTSVSPRQNSLSGVNPSGPFTTPAEPGSGERGPPPLPIRGDLPQPVPVVGQQPRVEVGGD